MPIEKLLVTVRDVEDQQPITDAVIDVADPTDALVVLAKAYEEEEYEQRAEKLEFDESPTTDEVARRNRATRDMAVALDDAGIDYEIRGVVGTEGHAFVELANSIDPDLLYVQGKSRSPAGKALFGSTAQEILLNAPCPVTYIRSG